MLEGNKNTSHRMITYAGNLKKYTILIFVWIFFGINLNALSQDQNPPLPGNLVDQLKHAYNQFDYDKCAEILNIAFNSFEHFSPSDKVEIYKYAAFIAFQNGNITLSANHFWNLLEINPTYSLNPVTTPPKLLTLFQKTKIEFLEDLNKRLNFIQKKEIKQGAPWRSFIFPGWGQWHRGYKTKGAGLMAGGLVSFGGVIYSLIKTSQSRKDYQSETDPEKIEASYGIYNSNYKKQYYFGYTFAALWAISQIDLVVWSGPKAAIEMALVCETPHVILPQLGFTVHFSSARSR